MPAHTSRHPWRAAACEKYLAPGLVELLGELAPGLPAAYDQDRAFGQLLLVAELLGEQLGHAGRHQFGLRWFVGALVAARSHHHAARGELARRQLESETLSAHLER